MTIKQEIIKLIGKAQEREAIELMKKLASSVGFSNEVLRLTRKLSELDSNDRRGLISQDTRQVEHNKIFDLLIQQVNILPDDLGLLISKLEVIINWRGETAEAINLLKSICDHRQQIELNNIQNSQSDYEDLLSADIPFDGIPDRSKQLEQKLQEVKARLSVFIDSLGLIDLKEDWSIIFLEYLKKERGEYLFEQKRKFQQEDASRYFEDIAETHPAIKKRLLLWQEEYLTGSYVAARTHLDFIRLELNEGSAQVYEYLMLTYLQEVGPDKIMRQALAKVDDAPFRKLLLYLERAKTSDTSLSSTRKESIQEVYDALMISARKFYANISHDYVSNRAAKGISKKRELVKSCIDHGIFIHEYCKKLEMRVGLNYFLEDLLLELNGGGKYDWIKIIEGELTNTTTYPAVEKHKQIIQFLDHDESQRAAFAEKLHTSLFRKSINLPHAVNPNNAKKKIIIQCAIASRVYGEDMFDQLRLSLAREESLTWPKSSPEASPSEGSEEAADEAAFLEAIADISAELQERNSSGLRNQPVLNPNSGETNERHEPHDISLIQIPQRLLKIVLHPFEHYWLWYDNASAVSKFWARFSMVLMLSSSFAYAVLYPRVGIFALGLVMVLAFLAVTVKRLF